MKRTGSELRLGTALFALVAGHTSALAQANVPPPNVAVGQGSSADDTNGGKAPGNEIVITGSRIRHNPLNQKSPITFVDRSDIEKTGLNSVSEVLQQLPSVGGGLNNRFNTSGNNGNPPDGAGVGAGAAEIDLRHLGSKRTLVIVDGLRFINGASASGVPGSVDLNVIPESMIERVEVLQDGASAIYGSDAIAGVVNIITKHGQRGLQASAQLGVQDRGDGFTQNYQLSWGNGTDRTTQIVAGLAFVKNGAVFAGDRAISAFPTPYGTSCLDGGCSSGTPLGRFKVLGQDLTLRGPVIGQPPTYNPADPTDPTSSFKAFTTADRFNFAPYNYLETPLERLGGFINLRQAVGSDTHLTVKLLANRRNSANQAAPLPLFVGPEAGNGNLLDRITIDGSNPYNPFGTLRSGLNLDNTPNGQTANYSEIARRLVEAGPRQYAQHVTTYYGTATLDGKLGVGANDWYWDINGILGHNKASQSFTGDVNAQKLAIALGPVATCNATPGCVPFDIFGGAGSVTPAMLNYVGYTEHDSSTQSLAGASANLSGKLFGLPGGELGLAAGAEYRSLKGRFDPDPITAAGFTADIPAQPTSGGYRVGEVYGELDAPVLRILDVTGAVRYSHYSTSGGKATWKVGANFNPIVDLRFRASYGTGFRAPTIGELFGSKTRFDAQLSDPCSADQNPSGAVLANCQSHGVPAGYQQNNPQISVVTGGNPALKAETSKGLVVGGVWSPAAMSHRVSLEIDYYKLAVDGAIQQVDAATILANCYDANDALACSAVPRTSSGQITQIQGVLQNIGGIRTSGFDVDLTARTARMSWGQLVLTANHSFLTRYDELVPTASGTLVIHRKGTEVGSPYNGFPKLKIVDSLDWNLANLGATLTGRYIGSMKESDGHLMPSRVLFDGQVRWSPGFMKDLALSIGVNNIFKASPPICTTCGIPNYDPNFYDIPGRYFYGRIALKM